MFCSLRVRDIRMPKYKEISKISKRGLRHRLAAVSASSLPAIDAESTSVTPATSSTPTPPTIFLDSDPDSNDEIQLSDISSDDEAMQDEEPPPEDVSAFLQRWTAKYNVQKCAVNELLKFLQSNGFSDLPSDSRTLLKTPRSRIVVPIPPGEYSHLGLKRALDHYVHSFAVAPSTLMMDINVDGVPISQSTKQCFWLILVCVWGANCPRSIYVVGVYHGFNKPKCFNAFLKPFIVEAKDLMGGYELDGSPVRLVIRCITCDAPACNSCLGTKSYNGHFGCGRCCQEGDCISHRITFPEIQAAKRTNESFREKAQPEHHIFDSPFLDLEIDMVSQFTLDPLHTIYLGVVRKVLGFMLKGDLRSRLQTRETEKMSSRLQQVAKLQPTEFQRVCRPMNELSNFKGTEFRSLILYILPVVAKGILPPATYDHLLLLHVACLILVDRSLCVTHADLAQQILEEYVGEFGEIYGREHVIYNVHSLLHVVDDVKRFGTLDEYSAFPFESYMYRIKRMLYVSKNALAQVCNRIEESYFVHRYRLLDKVENAAEVRYSMKKIVNSATVYEKVSFTGLEISTAAKNSWFLSVQREIFQFQVAKQEEKTVYARRIVNKGEFYDRPVSSVQFDVYTIYPTVLCRKKWLCVLRTSCAKCLPCLWTMISFLRLCAIRFYNL